MMNHIAISVIMPSLNVKDYIEDSIRSVLNQTMKNIEIICIDAGSNDGTWEIINQLAEEDGRIIAIHSEKRSYGYQINQGIAIAKGNYIAIVETDDYIDSFMCEKLYSVALSYDADIIKSNYYGYWTLENGSKFFIPKKLFEDVWFYNRLLIPKEHPEIAFGDWYLWTGIYKRKFLLENQIVFSETAGAAFQDIGFLHRTNMATQKAYYINEAFYYYCLNREDSSSNAGNGLMYSYQEFRSLNKEMHLNKDSFTSLYCRMAQSFFYCCSIRAMRYIKEIEKEYYVFFQEKLLYAIKNNWINSSIVPNFIWEKLIVLLESYEGFRQNIEQSDILRKQELGNSDVYKVIVFGCGSCGYNAYQWLKKQSYSIVAFIDNNSDLWNGIDILSPKDSLIFREDCKYLIANEKYSLDMKKQLVELGVNESRICIFI